ncbi:transmembrane 17B-like, partial [Brachionus plicatilis]
MKLLTKSSNSNFYSKLTDKSINLAERLKLAQKYWDFKDTNNFNKNQLIIEWIVDLIISKKNNSTDLELLGIWERLNFFLEECDSEKNPINNGQTFAQYLIETFTSSKGTQRELAFVCCSKLLKTKFSHYFTRNFDQMIKILNHYTCDLMERLEKNESENQLDDFLERSVLVFNKFLYCLKTQQNLNRLFNRICTQITFNLLNLMNQIDKLELEKFSVLKDLSWKILKFGLLSKSHSNLYSEFFKNLPNSFNTKSNYQVSILFSTIKSESIKTSENMNAMANYIGLITKELYSILSNSDYKLKISIIQFMVNVVWTLGENEEIQHEKMEIDSELFNSSEFIGKKMAALASIIQIVDDINLFNPIDDINNENIFKKWSKSLISQVLSQNINLTKFLIAFLKTDHLILEDDLDSILNILKNDANLGEFLNFFIDRNIKYRQLSTATLRLIDSIEKNKLKFPVEFYNHYSECLENYLVDNHTIINLWSDLIKILKEKSNVGKTEPLKFLKCIISRINLCNPSIPSGLKASAIKLLISTDEILQELLQNTQDDEMANAMDCYYTCGLLFVLMHRFTLQTVGQKNQSNLEVSISELNDKFFENLNEKFALSKQIKDEIKNLGCEKENFTKLFLLNKLQLLNVYRLNLVEIAEKDLKHLEETILNSNLMIKNSVNGEKAFNFLKKFSIESKIENLTYFTIVHGKFVLLDNFYLLIPLFRHKSDDLQKICSTIIKIIFCLKNNKTGVDLLIDKININAIFNDIDLIKPLFISLVDVLKELESNTETIKKNGTKHRKKYLDHIKELLENNFDLNLKNDFLKSKNLANYELNNDQIDLIFKMSELLPLEYLDSNYALVFNLLIELIKVENRQCQEKCLNIYNRLIATNLVSTLPSEKLESWLHNWFTLFQNLEFTENSKDQFRKILKKCLNHLMKEQNIDLYSNFIFNLNEKLKTEQNHNLNSLLNLTYLHTFERVCKIQEFTNTSDTDFDKKIKKLDQTIFEFFIKQNSIDDAELFFICSILIRSIASPKFKSDTNKETKLEHFKAIFENCLEQHKSYSKQIKDPNSNLKIGSDYFDYLNTLIVNADKLENFYQFKVDKVKLVKQLFKAYQKYDSKSGTDEDCLASNLKTAFVHSLNTFSNEDFKKILAHIDCAIDENFQSQTIKGLVKISQLIEYMANQVELTDILKQDFAEFLQKFAVKTPSIFLTLKFNNQLNELKDLLDSNIGIVASKYLIYTTTSFSNQNILGNDELNLAIKAAQDLDRIVAQLVSFKKDFSKIAPCMISEFVYKANTIPVHLSVKGILSNMVFNLISICDMHAISQLHVVLANGPKELFKNLYQEYEKYFKYTGKFKNSSELNFSNLKLENMQNNYKNQDFQTKFLQGLTKYASRPFGFDKMLNEDISLKKREVEYASSLPLQIILYFNVYYSIVWAIGTCFLWPLLVTRANDDNLVWIILILFAFSLTVILEIIRLYMGYVGNLSERIPELFVFYFITIINFLISLGLIAVVWVPINSSNSQILIGLEIPMQFALQIFHTFFIFLELIFGFIAIKVLGRYQISRFHYKQFDKNDLDSNQNDQDFEWLNELQKKNHIKMKEIDFDSK